MLYECYINMTINLYTDEILNLYRCKIKYKIK